MAQAPKRESAATRGYDRREMAEIRKQAAKLWSDWEERFDEYLVSMVGIDTHTAPALLVGRAEALADLWRDTVLKKRQQRDLEQGQ